MANLPQVEAEVEPQDLGNPEHVQARNRELKLVRREAHEDLRIMLSTPSGRRWMWKFLDKLGPYRTPFTSGDANMAYFAGGKQNVALELIGEITSVAPDLYALMQKENQDG